MIPLILLAMAASETQLPTPVPDPVLAEERGGFSLPGGLEVALTVETQTAIDGKVVLATVFKAVDQTPQFNAYVPRNGETVAAATHRNGSTASAAAMPTVVIDGRNGVRITPGTATPSVTLSRGSGIAAGLVRAAAGDKTDAGVIARNAEGAVRTVELKAGDISITHFAGAAFGSAIANSGSDRAIDTTTTVGIDLLNAGPDNLGSTMLRVGDVATNALMGRVN